MTSRGAFIPNKLRDSLTVVGRHRLSLLSRPNLSFTSRRTLEDLSNLLQPHQYYSYLTGREKMTSKAGLSDNYLVGIYMESYAPYAQAFLRNEIHVMDALSCSRHKRCPSFHSSPVIPFLLLVPGDAFRLLVTSAKSHSQQTSQMLQARICVELGNCHSHPSHHLPVKQSRRRIKSVACLLDAEYNVVVQAQSQVQPHKPLNSGYICLVCHLVRRPCVSPPAS